MPFYNPIPPLPPSGAFPSVPPLPLGTAPQPAALPLPALNVAPLPSVAEGPPTEGDHDARRTGWRTFLEGIKTDPDMKSALMSLGLGLMQDVPAGQSSLGFAAQQAENTLGYLTNLRSLRRKEDLEQKQLGLAERQIGVAEAGQRAQALQAGRAAALGEAEMLQRGDIAGTEASQRARQIELQGEENEIRRKILSHEISRDAGEERLKELDIQIRGLVGAAGVGAEIYRANLEKAQGTTGQERMAHDLGEALRKTDPNSYPTDESAYITAVESLQGGDSPVKQHAAIVKVLAAAEADRAANFPEEGPMNLEGIQQNATNIIKMTYPDFEVGKKPAGAVVPPPGGEAPPPAPPPQQGQSVKFKDGKTAIVKSTTGNQVVLGLPNGRTAIMTLDAYNNSVLQ